MGCEEMKEELKQQVLAIIVGKMIDAGWKEIGTAPQVRRAATRSSAARSCS